VNGFREPRGFSIADFGLWIAECKKEYLGSRFKSQLLGMSFGDAVIKMLVVAGVYGREEFEKSEICNRHSTSNGPRLSPWLPTPPVSLQIRQPHSGNSGM
jgi:hypothetical protein